MNYKAIEVSRHIINYSHEKQYEISNLRLQYILYYIQGVFLSKLNRKQGCFKEKIEVQEIGPIVPSIYEEYIEYTETDIPKVNGYLIFDKAGSCHAKRKRFTDDVIKEKDKKEIDIIIDQLAEKSLIELQEKIKQQDIWLKAYRIGIGTEITIEELKAYFDTLNELK